jgi:hypothetical protein
MKESRLGGQEQGILIPLMPSQSPVPVGLTPGLTPNWGTRLGSTPPAGAGAAGGGGGGAGAAGGGAGGAAPLWRALIWAKNVVDEAGQPTPGPLRFWRVVTDVWRRVIWDATELSVGNGAATPGLLTSWPAATSADSDCRDKGQSFILFV